MPSRKERAQIATQTVEILDCGEYSLPNGTTVSIADDLRAARDGTTLYTPEWLAAELPQMLGAASAGTTKFQVENCTTFAATKRLVEQDEQLDPLCLNFASAKNPGGGFLNGSQAQEESLSRASGLYACINPARVYYETNRVCGTCLYTHHMIYSPRVPVFRDDDDQLLPAAYRASIITAPAVNAGALRQNAPAEAPLIESTMLERMERILALAAWHGHHTIILGAWGCGVFRNEPASVAKWFHHHLVGERFRSVFRKVVFAVLDRSDKQDTYLAFARQFDGETSGFQDLE